MQLALVDQVSLELTKICLPLSQVLSLKLYDTTTWKCGTFTQMEYYTVEKNDTLKFEDKWMELKNIVLSEVIQTQKDKYHMYSLLSVF